MHNEDFDAIAYINEPRWHTMSLGLDRIYELLRRLGNPQDKLSFVHVAGTNGKGSTCACIASILKSAGYKVGLFTSPYIEYFEERIRINGTPISSHDLEEVTLMVRDAAEAMTDHPTEFELMTAVAFLYFSRQSCDIVVAEVGLGGRLDSTNVIAAPEVGVIAPISYDHCALLGNTLAEIAGEKAGIIKSGMTVVSANQENEAAEVLRSVAADKDAQLRFVNSESVQGINKDFSYSSHKGVLYEHLALGLVGSYQRFDNALRMGLSETQWPGRFEVISHAPEVIIDGAHNIHAARQLVKELDLRFPLRRIIFCVGVMSDKDYQAMLALYAPLAKAFVCYAPNLDRALAPNALAAEAMRALANLPEEDHGQGCLVQACSSAADAVHNAFAMANEHDVICCCGSLYGIAAVKEALKSELA